MAELNGRDRLSELPDSLIREILSLLEMEDVVRTTILSKRWKDLWTTVSCLQFCDGYSKSFIEGALAKWKGEKIKKFSIIFTVIPATACDIVDSWLLVAIQKNVEELDINGGPKIHPAYSPPQCLYSCSSLKKLSLSFADLKVWDNVNVQLNQLKCLKIDYPYILRDDFMKRIIRGAPLLEELILFASIIVEDMNIRSTSLKTLVVGRSDPNFIRTVVMPSGTLSVWAPNLSSLRFSGCVYGALLLDAPSLSNAVIRFKRSCDGNGHDAVDHPPLGMLDQVFRSLSHVEKLTFSHLSLKLLIDTMENDMVAQFSNTKFLKLQAAEAERLLDVLGMFPELMMLVVELDKKLHYKVDNEQCVAAIDACDSLASEMTFPNPFLLQLKTVEITWSIGDASVLLPVVQLLLGNARVLEKLVLRLRDVGGDIRTFTLAKNKLQSMPRSSPTAQVVIRGQW